MITISIKYIRRSKAVLSMLFISSVISFAYSSLSMLVLLCVRTSVCIIILQIEGICNITFEHLFCYNFLLPKLCSKADTNRIVFITFFLYIYCITFGIICTIFYHFTISYIICKYKEVHTKRTRHKSPAPASTFCKLLPKAKNQRVLVNARYIVSYFILLLLVLA